MSDLRAAHPRLVLLRSLIERRLDVDVTRPDPTVAGKSYKGHQKPVIAVGTLTAFESMSQAARALGVCEMTIRRAIDYGRFVRGRKLVRATPKLLRRLAEQRANSPTLSPLETWVLLGDKVTDCNAKLRDATNVVMMDNRGAA